MESDVASDSCSTYRDCTSCMRGGKCNWCEKTHQADSCQLASDCTGNLVTDNAKCPAAGAGVSTVVPMQNLRYKYKVT